jgi:hypothetical protein
MSFEMLRFEIWISISWELGNSLNFHFINSMFVGYVSIMDIKLRDMNRPFDCSRFYKLIILRMLIGCCGN